MSGLTPPPVHGPTTCKGSAATATPSLDPTAASLLQQYLACVSARGWCKVAFETSGGFQRFEFSCEPSPTSSPRAPQKRRANEQRQAQGNLRRAAWVKRRNHRSKPANSTCPADETAVTAAACTAAAETATVVSCPTTTTTTAA
jgi:hypothetical protein